MIVAFLVAIAIPLVFLYLVRALDLYASESMRAVFICLAWGGLGAFFGAYLINNSLVPYFGLLTLERFVAPVVEEILKSLVLIYLVRRPQFTYFVDGAVYGFATGTAFAVFENILYLSGTGANTALTVAVSRAFSASLMHGSASALVGVALGRLRFGRGPTRAVSVILGWAAAMALHISFNNVVTSEFESTWLIVLAIGLGLGGVALNAGFIFWGLSQERRWLHDTLKLDVGVSHQESSVVQKLADLDTLLKPIAERFGEEKRKQVEEFLKLQAQLGLKRKVEQVTPDDKLRAKMHDEIQELHVQMDKLRREVGVYCMSYVRSILPDATAPLWIHLGQQLTDAVPTSGKSLWGSVDTKLKSRDEAASDSE